MVDILDSNYHGGRSARVEWGSCKPRNLSIRSMMCEESQGNVVVIPVGVPASFCVLRSARAEHRGPTKNSANISSKGVSHVL